MRLKFLLFLRYGNALTADRPTGRQHTRLGGLRILWSEAKHVGEEHESRGGKPCSL